MKKLLLFIGLQFCLLATAQQKITFNYDAAGNQIIRELCLSGCSQSAKKVEDVKEIEALTEDDLLKFSPEDVISYYPNPVKEELFLQWQLGEENYVTSVQVYNMVGQILQTYQGNERMNSLNIPFQNYPGGVYLVLLSYKDGGEKSIKIIKQ
ncbi:T9SS type A sorting domain-containing protein [Flavobacterium sp. N502536]|uniref:T9SS type A sorting domain-containing protein n=1 Tax=Flavobacterium sp. N502536 TaxID=2986837 RepID=UPI002223CBE8|nr:T9SS type A sorting domain-containing protein [Flavobacterium sp. N502536]